MIKFECWSDDIKASVHFNMNFDIPGWQSLSNLAQYAKWAAQVPKGGTIVEIGAGLGIGTWVLAKNCQSDVMVYAIDMWKGRDPNPKKKTYMKNYKEGLRNDLETFLYYTRDCNNIRPIVAHSPRTQSKLRDVPSPDLVILDVEHDYQEWKENILFWHSRLSSHGVLAGCDLETTEENLSREDFREVRRGIYDGAKELGRVIKHRPPDTYWQLA